MCENIKEEIREKEIYKEEHFYKNVRCAVWYIDDYTIKWRYNYKNV